MRADRAFLRPHFGFRRAHPAFMRAHLPFVCTHPILVGDRRTSGQLCGDWDAAPVFGVSLADAARASPRSVSHGSCCTLPAPAVKISVSASVTAQLGERGSSVIGTCRIRRTRSSSDPPVAAIAIVVRRRRASSRARRAPARSRPGRRRPRPRRRRSNARVRRGCASRPTTRPGDRTAASRRSSAARSPRSRGGGCARARARGSLRPAPASAPRARRPAAGSPAAASRRPSARPRARDSTTWAAAGRPRRYARRRHAVCQRDDGVDERDAMQPPHVPPAARHARQAAARRRPATRS